MLRLLSVSLWPSRSRAGGSLMVSDLGPSGGRSQWWGQYLGTGSPASAVVCPVPSCFWGWQSLIERILVPLPWPLRRCLSSCCKKCLGVKGGFRGRSPDPICYCSICAVLCRWHPPLLSSLLQSFSFPLIHTFQYLVAVHMVPSRCLPALCVLPQRGAAQRLSFTCCNSPAPAALFVPLKRRRGALLGACTRTML